MANGNGKRGMKRRRFLETSVGAVGAVSAAGTPAIGATVVDPPPAAPLPAGTRRPYNGVYTGENLLRVAFPLGGMGAGMICLEGTGALSHVSLKHRPEVFNEPCVFAAVHVKGAPAVARVLEGPVPSWKLFGLPDSGNGLGGTTFGLPRLRTVTFEARFPFGTVRLQDPMVPLEVTLTGWSPFEPGDADGASLPVAGLEYTFRNPTARPVEAVFSWNARNFLPAQKGRQAVRATKGGFVLWGTGEPGDAWDEASFCARVADPSVRVNAAWFRGDWWDPLTLAWQDVARGACYDRPPITEGRPAPGATLFVPLTLAPGASRTIVLRLSWYVGTSHLRAGEDPQAAAPAAAASQPGYEPWYAGRFAGIEELAGFWDQEYDGLRERTQRFSACFYDTSLPPEVVEAVAANLTILKSPTVLRQADGRLWAWEGCNDSSGCCHGSCTHVWNYAQALSHLFPALERTLRETEFNVSQDLRGHQTFRTNLPIRPTTHDFHAAADGQLGGILKVYREWRICGDLAWLRGLWPRVRTSLDYGIEAWDPRHRGVVEEPHHNTYDIEFWGPDGMCSSFYLAALRAAVLMGEALGAPVPLYAELLEKGRRLVESELWNGEYFVQRIEWKTLRAKSPLETKSYGGAYSEEALALLEKEGPKYQYGEGCLADGVLGAWLAAVCGVGDVLDREKVRSHVRAVHRHNLRQDLSEHANPQRPTYACGAEGGLLICTWPRGGALTLPFVYSNEVWTGIEYQVASHLMLMGLVEEGREVVRIARDRYDGRVRNPFDEYECGHWYARAMSSYALIQGLSGARYDAVEKVLHLEPSVRGDFRAFLSTATGYGTVGVRSGQPFLDVRQGRIEVERIAYTPRA
ncbi:MAG TPA: GH116 family glycosyl hydrolase [Vicinamibacteria bacterium]|nr:GH116 family glycosyl hydrolase [Vicinamibacteria bacterium]